MRFLAFLYIVFCSSFLISSTPTITAYVNEDRVNLTCHYDNASYNLYNDSMAAKIDARLDELYSLITLNATYEADCDRAVDFNFTYLSRNGELVQTTVNMDLDELLEGFELQIDKYKEGLWGYCAMVGAEELYANISAVIATAKSQNLTICDRSKLLSCHSKFSKCQCLVDMKNFRTVASEYWDDTEGSKDYSVSIGKDGCVLLPGSYCPIGNAAIGKASYMCHPGSTCLYKYNKSACNSLHKQVKILERTVMIDATTKNMTTDHHREQEETNGKLSIKADGKSAVADDKYRFIRDDYPSSHCQCFVHVGKGSGAGILLFSWKELLYVFALFYFSNHH